jgi:hypothetical protein
MYIVAVWHISVIPLPLTQTIIAITPWRRAKSSKHDILYHVHPRCKPVTSASLRFINRAYHGYARSRYRGYKHVRSCYAHIRILPLARSRGHRGDPFYPLPRSIHNRARPYCTKVDRLVMRESVFPNIAIARFSRRPGWLKQG